MMAEARENTRELDSFGKPVQSQNKILLPNIHVWNWS